MTSPIESQVIKFGLTSIEAIMQLSELPLSISLGKMVSCTKPDGLILIKSGATHSAFGLSLSSILMSNEHSAGLPAKSTTA